MRGRSVMSVLLPLGALLTHLQCGRAEPWPIGGHAAPQGIAQTVGEHAVWYCHTGVDILANYGDDVLAVRAGKCDYRPTEDPPECIIYGVPPPGQPWLYQDKYRHTKWHPKDGQVQPDQDDVVEALRVITHVDVFPGCEHLHFEMWNAEEVIINPVPLLDPAPTWKAPEIVDDDRMDRAGKNWPFIYVVHDKAGIHGEFTFDKTLLNGRPRYYVNGDADIIAWIRSQSDCNWIRQPQNDEDRYCMPYQATLKITCPTNDAYRFERTLFRFDTCPSIWIFHDSNTLFNLIFDLSSHRYDKFRVIMTNCDGTDHFQGAQNIREDCWPAGQQDEAGAWKVPNGEYLLAVTISDYGGAPVSREATAVVDHGDKTVPKKGG